MASTELSAQLRARSALIEHQLRTVEQDRVRAANSAMQVVSLDEHREWYVLSLAEARLVNAS